MIEVDSLVWNILEYQVTNREWLLSLICQVYIVVLIICITIQKLNWVRSLDFVFFNDNSIDWSVLNEHVATPDLQLVPATVWYFIWTFPFTYYTVNQYD